MKTLILTLFGEKVDWMSHYIENCANVAQHSAVEWKIFTDKGYCGRPGVEVIHMSLPDFFQRFEEKMGRPLDNASNEKMWDIRPAYGIIFNDYIKDYWGHTDHDCVYGNIDKFTEGDWEIFSNDPYPTICGHFTLYKNTDKVNNLFKEYPLWEEQMFGKDVHILTRPISGNLSPFSFTTKRLVDEGKLNIKYDFDCQGNDKEPHTLEYKDGLYMDGKEILVYHFRKGKQWPIK